MNLGVTTSPPFSHSRLDRETALGRSKSLPPSAAGLTLTTFSSLAYSELRVILAKVLYNFDLSLAPESVGWDKQKVFFLWEKRKLMVRLKERAKAE